MTFIAPMLLESAEAPFNDDNYIFEPLIDGHRLILSHKNGTTRLYTRHYQDCTRQYPELLSSPYPEDIILDGEVACTNERGAICYDTLMERLLARKSSKIRSLSDSKPVNYMVFDILSYKGIDLRGLPLERRKEILRDAALPLNPNIAQIPYHEDEGTLLFSHIKSWNLEGIVAKRKNSIYVSNRSDAWQKIIDWKYAQVYITGYAKGNFSLVASVPAGKGRMRPVGWISSGFTPKQQMALYCVRDSWKTGEDSEYVYLQPRLKARVRHRGWTRAGMLRSPEFVELIGV